MLSLDSAFEMEPTDEPMQFRWSPAEELITPAGHLQGGAGLGATVAAMTAVTGRPLVWATAHYLSFAAGRTPLDLNVAVEVAGHHTTQARCVLSRDGAEVLTAHAALGARSFEHEGLWAGPTPVDAPEACPPYRFFDPVEDAMGRFVDIRLAHGRQLDQLDGTPGSGRSALWLRCWRGTHQFTANDLAYLGDLMPLGFADALGHPFGGTSLDNTIRVGELVATRWVLLDVHIQQVHRGFGVGHAQLWAEDGTLLGAVSQSTVMRLHRQARTAT
jgi:acyl-CoA thioesterase